MLLLPALCIKRAVEKRFFVLIVKEKATKGRKNPAILRKAKEPGSIQLEHRWLQ